MYVCGVNIQKCWPVWRLLCLLAGGNQKVQKQVFEHQIFFFFPFLCFPFPFPSLFSFPSRKQCVVLGKQRKKGKQYVVSQDVLLPAELSAGAVTLSSDGCPMRACHREAAKQKDQRCHSVGECETPHASQSGMSPLSLR